METANLAVKITYKLHGSSQLLLTRRPPSIIKLYSDSDDLSAPSTSSLVGRFAQLSLKSCLSTVCLASPEFLSDPSHDYSIYVLDPTEESASTPKNSPTKSSSSSGVLVGKGFLSALTEPSKADGQQGDGEEDLIWGKVVKDGIRGQAVKLHLVLQQTTRQRITTPDQPASLPVPEPRTTTTSPPDIATLFLSMLASTPNPATSTAPADASQMVSLLATCLGMQKDPSAFQTAMDVVHRLRAPEPAPPPPPEPKKPAPIRKLNFLSTRIKSVPDLKFSSSSLALDDDEDEIVEISKPSPLTFGSVATSNKENIHPLTSVPPAPGLLSSPKSYDSTVARASNPYLPKPPKQDYYPRASSSLVTRSSPVRKHKSSPKSKSKRASKKTERKSEASTSPQPPPGFSKYTYFALPPTGDGSAPVPIPSLPPGSVPVNPFPPPPPVSKPVWNGWCRRAGLPPAAPRSTSIPPPTDSALDLVAKDEGKGRADGKKRGKRRSLENDIEGVGRSTKRAKKANDTSFRKSIEDINGASEATTSPQREVATSPIRQSMYALATDDVQIQHPSPSSPIRGSGLALPRPKGGLVLPGPGRVLVVPSTPTRPSARSRIQTPHMDLDDDDEGLFGPSPAEIAAQRDEMDDVEASPTLTTKRGSRISPPQRTAGIARAQPLFPEARKLVDIARQLNSDAYSQDLGTRSKEELLSIVGTLSDDMNRDISSDVAPTPSPSRSRGLGLSMVNSEVDGEGESAPRFTDVPRKRMPPPSSPLPPSSPPLSLLSDSCDDNSSRDCTPRIGSLEEILEEDAGVEDESDEGGDLFDALEIELGQTAKDTPLSGDTTLATGDSSDDADADKTVNPSSLRLTGMDAATDSCPGASVSCSTIPSSDDLLSINGSQELQQQQQQLNLDALVQMLMAAANAPPQAMDKAVPVPGFDLFGGGDTGVFDLNALLMMPNAGNVAAPKEDEPVTTGAGEFDILQFLNATPTASAATVSAPAITPEVQTGFSSDDFASFVESLGASH